jgi:hypothetical protein
VRPWVVGPRSPLPPPTSVVVLAGDCLCNTRVLVVATEDAWPGPGGFGGRFRSTVSGQVFHVRANQMGGVDTWAVDIWEVRVVIDPDGLLPPTEVEEDEPFGTGEIVRSTGVFHGTFRGLPGQHTATLYVGDDSSGAAAAAADDDDDDGLTRFEWSDHDYWVRVSPQIPEGEPPGRSKGFGSTGRLELSSTMTPDEHSSSRWKSIPV